jgi:hypothetical protein
MGWVVNATPRGDLPAGKETRYAFYKRLGGPQDRSGWVRKTWPPPGFHPRTVKPVASRYTNWAIPAHRQNGTFSYYFRSVRHVELKKSQTRKYFVLHLDQQNVFYCQVQSFSFTQSTLGDFRPEIKWLVNKNKHNCYIVKTVDHATCFGRTAVRMQIIRKIGI